MKMPFRPDGDQRKDRGSLVEDKLKASKRVLKPSWKLYVSIFW